MIVKIYNVPRELNTAMGEGRCTGRKFTDEIFLAGLKLSDDTNDPH